MQFFKSLFDLSFSKFISTTVIGVIFIIGVIGIFVLCVFLYDAYFDDDAWLLLLPIILVCGTICWRVTLEMYVALIRIAENTTKLVEMKESTEG